MKTDWLAIFKSDLTTKVFEDKVKSEDVLYWIKRFENGKLSEPSYVGLTKPLRNFEFLDTDFNPCSLTFGATKSWKCLTLIEKDRDNTGSYSACNIVDDDGEVREIRVVGNDGNAMGGLPISVSQDLYFTAIVLFLKMIGKYKNWKDLEMKNINLFEDISKHNGIPQAIFKQTKDRDIELRKVWYNFN